MKSSNSCSFRYQRKNPAAMNIERGILEGAGFQLVSGQWKNEDEVIEQGRDADGVLTQYAPVGARASTHSRAAASLPATAPEWTSSTLMQQRSIGFKSRTHRTSGVPKRLPTVF